MGTAKAPSKLCGSIHLLFLMTADQEKISINIYARYDNLKQDANIQRPRHDVALIPYI